MSRDNIVKLFKDQNDNKVNCRITTHSFRLEGDNCVAALMVQNLPTQEFANEVADKMLEVIKGDIFNEG